MHLQGVSKLSRGVELSDHTPFQPIPPCLPVLATIQRLCLLPDLFLFSYLGTPEKGLQKWIKVVTLPSIRFS